MKMQEPSHLQCRGRVKYSGIDTGNATWKNGVLILENVNGRWKMNLEYDVCPGKPQKSFILYPGVIKKLICKSQLVIELQPSGCSTMNFHLIPHSPKDDQDKERFNEKLRQIQQSTEFGETFGVKSDSRVTPSKPLADKVNSWSPETFTSVKSRESRKRSFSLDDSSDDEGKENRTKLSSEKFLERAEEKSKSWSSSLSTPIKFYGSTAGPTYASYSAKRTPGLMPDPVPRKGLVNYSWTRPKPTVPTNSAQHQPNLQGFSNLGNTCYMNAILQSLVNLDTFTTDLLYGNKKILRTLEPTSLYRCMVQVFTSRLRVISDFSKREYLKNLKHAISSSAKRFSGFQQHDAHEFLGQLLDQLKEEVTKISKSTPSPHRDEEEVEYSSKRELVNPTVQNFEFEVLHKIKCENCGEEVTKEEQFNDLSVDMPRTRDPTNPRSLQDALELSLKKETIDYSCEKCSCGKAEVTHKFTKLPRVLVLHLKRYSYNMMMSKQAKAGQNISIPRYLTLQSHCIEDTRPPFPTIPPPEPKSLTIPDSPLREKHENTPRRRLDTNPSFKFKPSRVLRDFDEDPEKASTQQTSTPFKKLKEDPEIIPDRKINLDDENEDSELAKALELSLKEANDRAQGFYDEVDGCAPNNDITKALEMSRQESEARSHDHEYEKNIGIMTEEEQIELALKRSMMEFELMQNSFYSEDVPKDEKMECDTMENTYSAESIRKECSMAVADDLLQNQDEKSASSVTSKYFKNEQGSKLKQSESSNYEKPIFSTNYSPIKSSKNEATFHELSENNYFNSGERKEKSKSPITEECKSSRADDSVHVVRSEDEVMIISDGSADSENDEKTAKSKNSGSDILDAASSDICSVKSKYANYDASEKPKLSMDLQNILMVDEMSADDVKPIRTVIRESGRDTEKKPDIVDLFCSEDDDFLMDQWDKENSNPDKYEVLPPIDNERGDLPYSYRLVSIVNHIGSSSVVGHYVSDVYDIKKASWFSCDDSHVSKATEADVRLKRERSGYIFFYLHKDIFDDLKDHYDLHSKKPKSSS